MKSISILAAVMTATIALSSCGSLQNTVVSYTGDSIELTNADTAPAADAVKAVGWNLETKKAYYVTADGVRHNVRITGGGASLSGGVVVLHLEGGGKVVIDTKTWKLQTSAPVAPPEAPGK